LHCLKVSNPDMATAVRKLKEQIAQTRDKYKQYNDGRPSFRN